MDENTVFGVNDDEPAAPITNLELGGLRDVIGPLLSSSTDDVYSANRVLSTHLPLRQCNTDYGNAGGCKFQGTRPSELDRVVVKGCVAPLRRFHNVMGHFVEGSSLGNPAAYATACFDPEFCNTARDMTDALKSCLSYSTRRGRLWALDRCNEYTTNDNINWSSEKGKLQQSIGSAMSLIAVSFPPPLSVHSIHAWLECQDVKGHTISSTIFKQPQETTSVAGLLGTLHNCQTVDMAQEADDEHINKSKRYEDADDFEGFICSGHTSHSTEAGRVRKTCSNVHVRVMSDAMLTTTFECMSKVSHLNMGLKSWVLYCMGKMLKCTSLFLLSLRDSLECAFDGSLTRPVLMYNSETRAVLLSVTSGVLLRRDAVGACISSVSPYCTAWPDGKYTPSYPEITDSGGMEFYFSTFFLCVPYIVYDRPPRTLMASVQCVQAVSTPYGAGTSSVAPTSICKPLVTTELAERIRTDPSAGLADHLPGQPLVVCIANLNDTYEDSIIMSDASAARGLYNYMAYSSHVIGSKETVPGVGEVVSMDKHRWWKSYPSRDGGHRDGVRRVLSDGTKVIPCGVDGTGVVVSKSLTPTDQISVRVLRFSRPVTGDKLAMGHGQKGTIKLWKEEDMPYGIDENGEPIKFDIIMSLSSVSNRLTEGQYYEMVTGVNAVREGRRMIIEPERAETDHTETVLYDGTTGQILTRRDTDGRSELNWEGDIPIYASWGICNVWQMTQLTWDKQHYTHNTAGKGAMGTSTGRTNGGGIRFGEMESHAATSSGIINCQEELKSRMDLVDCYICYACNMLPEMCACGSARVPMPVSMPRALEVFAYTNLITSGYVTKYKVEFKP